MEMTFFCLHYTYEELLQTYSPEEQGRLLMGVLHYARTGEEPILEGAERHAWPFLKLQCDRDQAAYEEKYRRSKANGAKGGRPRKTPKNQGAEEETESEEGSAEAAEEQTEKTKAASEKPGKSKPVSEKPKKTKAVSEKPKKPILNENGNGNENENGNVNGNENEKPPSVSPRGEERGGFDRFWEAYPRRVGKQEAKKAFSRVKAPLERLLDALEQQKRSEQWQRDGGRFIPYPATWLNQGRWEDELRSGPPGRNDIPTMEEYFRGLEEFL